MRSIASASICATTMVLTACSVGHGGPAFLINDSNDNLAVEVSMPRLHEATCRFDPQYAPIVIGTVEQARQGDVRSMRPVPLANYDPENCTATIAVPPQMALMMFSGKPCNGSARTPVIDRLSIAGGNRSILLTGNETAAAFKSSMWRRDCRFVIR